MATENKIRIGITQGDINGVGPEVIVKALGNPEIVELFTPVVFGDAEVLKKAAEYSLEDSEFAFKEIDSAAGISDGEINIVNIPTEDEVYSPGHSTKASGTAAIAALEKAVEAINAGEIDLLVTAPFDKQAVQSDDFNFPGHTEYLQSKFGIGETSALMILADDRLRVSLVTTHAPLKDISKLITKDGVERAIKAFNMALKMDFGCERPKIGVLSLNPHCGDGGVLGAEETEVITPAIEACRKEGILAFGPISADGLFGSGAYRNYDGILAMYHDQGLAPFKALARGGVNFTAGLDIIRTSPAHGTALDIAGKGIADESSMREAIYAAIDIARRRDSYLVASENPLAHYEPVKREKKKEDKAAAVEQQEVE